MIIFIIGFLVILTVSAQNSYSQLPGFDSSYVIISSPEYDYKNPIHCSNASENVYSFTPLNKNWLAYERHESDSTVNIMVRYYDFDGYGNEINITNDTNVKNINPSISGEEGHYILVWQSNKHGIWDIFFSIYTSGNWSQPQILDSSSADKTNPSIIRPGFYDHYFLAYEKDSNIVFKVYDQLWLIDTTISVNNVLLSYPVLTGMFYSYLSYISINASMESSLKSKRAFYSPTTNQLTFDTTISAPQVNPGRPNGGLNTFGTYVGFNFDTLGYKRAMFLSVPGGYTGILADTITGNFFDARSNTWPIVIDNQGLSFQAFACVYQKSDSTYIAAAKYFYPNAPINYYSLFYIGDSLTNTKLSVGNVSYSILGYYLKYRAVWEQEINGRTALVESFMVDFNTNISTISGNHPGTYSLHQNYPNPFNPVTRIRFEIPSGVRGERSEVRLLVFDVTGREVAELVNGELQPGVYEYEFDGTGLGSGVYFYKLQSGEFSETRRMVLVK